MSEPWAALAPIRAIAPGRRVVALGGYPGGGQGFSGDGLWPDEDPAASQSPAHLLDALLRLEHADLHDCRDGHSTKEAYVYESRIGGVRTNRRRIFVLCSTVVSISALADAVQEDLAG